MKSRERERIKNVQSTLVDQSENHSPADLQGEVIKESVKTIEEVMSTKRKRIVFEH
jgi:hypothetical protein